FRVGAFVISVGIFHGDGFPRGNPARTYAGGRADGLVLGHQWRVFSDLIGFGGFCGSFFWCYRNICGRGWVVPDRPWRVVLCTSLTSKKSVVSSRFSSLRGSPSPRSP